MSNLNVIWSKGQRFSKGRSLLNSRLISPSVMALPHMYVGRYVGMWIGVCVVAILCNTSSVFAAKKIGKVAYLSGAATMSIKSVQGGAWQPLYKGDALYQGSRIKTKRNARFEGRLHDGSMIRLGGSSDIKLQTASFNKKKKTKLFKARLFVGSMWASVTKLFGTASRFEVATDNAVAGVRGTRFSARRDKDGSTTVKVYSGKVLVSNKPAYAVKGATKKSRVQVAGPQEITKQQWEEMVTTAMQVVRVAQGGAMEKPTAFAMAEQDDWEAWNTKRDKLAGIHQ